MRHSAVFHSAVVVLTATAVFAATFMMVLAFVMLAAAFFPAAFFLMMVLMAFVMTVTAVFLIASAGFAFGFLAAFLATAFSASASLTPLGFLFFVTMVHFFFVLHVIPPFLSSYARNLTFPMTVSRSKHPPKAGNSGSWHQG
jgi:hypothetical protein